MWHNKDNVFSIEFSVRLLPQNGEIGHSEQLIGLESGSVTPDTDFVGDNFEIIQPISFSLSRFVYGENLFIDQLLSFDEVNVSVIYN